MGLCLSTGALTQMLYGASVPRHRYALSLGVPIAPATRLLDDVSAGALVSMRSCRFFPENASSCYLLQSDFTTASAIEALLDSAGVSGGASHLYPYLDSIFGHRGLSHDNRADVETRVRWGGVLLFGQLDALL